MSAYPVERAADEAGYPIKQGVFVAVAGPSGSGKDSLIAYARDRLGHLHNDNDIVFARRAITRPALPGTEEHDTLSKADFERARAAGRFALSWCANGLSYGLPASLDDEMRAGRVVVANVSRAVIPQLGQRYAQVVPVIVTAPRNVLARRLSSRGRETMEEVLARLERSEAGMVPVPGAIVIDNSGSLEEAGNRFLEILRKAAAWSDTCDRV